MQQYKKGNEVFREPVTLCVTKNTTGEHTQNVLKLEEAEREIYL